MTKDPLEGSVWDAFLGKKHAFRFLFAKNGRLGNTADKWSVYNSYLRLDDETIVLKSPSEKRHIMLHSQPGDQNLLKGFHSVSGNKWKLERVKK